MALALAEVAFVAAVAACGSGDGSPSDPSPSGMAETAGTSSASTAAFTPIKEKATVALSFAQGSPVEPIARAALTDAGFTVQSRFGQQAGDQDHVLGLLLQAQPAVLVVQAVDPAKATARLKQAHEHGVKVIMVGGLPTDASLVDYYVGPDPAEVGRLQAQAVTQCVRPPVTGAPTPRAELFAAPRTDALAKPQFDSTLAGLKDRVAAKTLDLGSGAGDFDTSALSPSQAGSRMTDLLGAYGSGAPSAVVGADDVQAWAVREALVAAKKSTPCLVGAGSTAQAVTAIMAGQMAASTYTPTAVWGDAVAGLVTDLTKPTAPRTDQDGLRAGAGTVAARRITTQLVMRNTAATVLRGDKALAELVR